MPPLNRNSFLANQHRSPLNNAISSVVLSPNPVKQKSTFQERNVRRTFRNGHYYPERFAYLIQCPIHNGGELFDFGKKRIKF